MRGSIFKRSNLWTVQIERDRDPLTGKRRRELHSGYRTRREAQAARVEILSRLQRGEYVTPSKLTLGDFLLDRWLPTRQASWRRPRSSPTPATSATTSSPGSAQRRFRGSQRTF